MSIVSLMFSFFLLPSRMLAISSLNQLESAKDLEKFGLGGYFPWRSEWISSDAKAPGLSNSDSKETLVLAKRRTNRPDILHGLKYYHDGWDIANRHYWASVCFTGAVGFILAALWLISFGLMLVVYHCCKWRINIKHKESPRFQKICFMLLAVFTFAAIVGCVLLTVGQDEFHDEAFETLNYVINQSDYTVETLRNVTQYLFLAKTISVAHVFLPSNIMDDIDKLNGDLNVAATTLTEKTSENARKISIAFRAVRSSLIAMAVVMLLLALVGFVLTFLGRRHTLYVLVGGGWLLVVLMFVLSGVFVVLRNVISDTCLAMDEWVGNPHAESALSSILPCVDQRTTNQSLVQSKVVINDVVNVVNTFIYTFANANPSSSDFGYYNQTGPTLPPLCYPFDSLLQERECNPIEVSISNASMAWEKYRCSVSSTGFCITTGRVTPDIHRQLAAAVNETYALRHYTPLLLNLQNCKVVMNTFQHITSTYCHPLVHYLQIVNVGLVLISVGVLLCLMLWILFLNHLRSEQVLATLFLLLKTSLIKSFKCRFINNTVAEASSYSNQNV